MGLGPQTAVIDGNRVSVPTYNAFNPVGYSQSVQIQPVHALGTPPMAGAAGGTGVTGYPEGVGGYGTSGNNLLNAQVAGNNPWNLRVSPTPWAIIGLILAVFLMASVHWRKTVLEGDETLHVAGAHESANAGA